jgi:hypothetical protein
MLAPLALLSILGLLLLLVMVWTLSPMNRLLFSEMTGRWGRPITVGLLSLALLVLILVSPKLWANPDLPARLAPSLGVRSAELVAGQAPVASPGIGLTPQNSSNSAANAQFTLTFAAVANRTNFVTGFEVTYGGATAATSVVVTLSGVVGGTQSWLVAVPAVPASGVNSFVVEFTYPLQAAGPNTAMVLTVPAAGAGNTNATASMHGYLQ